MATGVNYTKSGTVIQCSTSVLPRPRPQLAYPVPVFSGTENSFLVLTLETIAETSRSGVRVTTPVTLPGSALGTWTLCWTAYQGTAPTAISWNRVPFSWADSAATNRPALHLLVDSVMPSATFVAYLERVEAGQTSSYAHASLTTPEDTTLAVIGAILSDGWISQGTEKLTLQRDWTVAQSEHAALLLQAARVFNNTLGTGDVALEAVAYDAAYQAISAIASLWADSTVSTDVSAVTPSVKTRWENYDTERADLLALITYRLNPPRLTFAVNTGIIPPHPMDLIPGEMKGGYPTDPTNNWTSAQFAQAFGVAPVPGMAGLVAAWQVDITA